MDRSPVICNFGTSTIIINDKPHHCKYCDRSFEKIYSLKLHLRRHFPKKEFLCNICRKEFCNLNSYKGHINRHTGEKPFVCTICDKRYPKNEYARRHVKNHLFKKPNCWNGFFRIQHFIRHVGIEHKCKVRRFYRVFNNALPDSVRFQLCNVCRKQFSSVSNLIKHHCKKEKKLIVFNNISCETK